MTTRTLIRCDGCDREQPSAADASRWGQLITKDASGRPHQADLCPACIAKLHGWANPYVAGTTMGVREFARRSA